LAALDASASLSASAALASAPAGKRSARKFRRRLVPGLDHFFLGRLLCRLHTYGILLHMMPKRILAAAILLAAISGCSSVPKLVTEYRIDVQQGNVLTQEMVSQLKPGQTREQVRFILGTPLLVDMFHADRWDYVYRLRKGKTDEVETRRFTVFFDADGRLFRVAGDVAAAQAGDIAAEPEVRSRLIDLGSVPEGTTAPPPEERGFFGKMMETVGF